MAVDEQLGMVVGTASPWHSGLVEEPEEPAELVRSSGEN